MEIRQTTLADVKLLAQYRAAQLVDEGETRDDSLLPQFEEFFAAEMAAGNVRGWCVEVDGEPVAVASVSVFPWPPTFTYAAGRYGYVQSVYTRPEHRGKGYASRLVQTGIDWLHSQGITRIFLGASPAGRPVYEKLGFAPASHFMIKRD